MMIKNKEKNFISIVVYLHRDGNSIKSFLQDVLPIYQNNFLSYEFIFVDDGADADELTFIKEELGKYKNNNLIVQIIHMSFYQGIEHAMKAGVDLAIGDFIFEFDDISCQYTEEMIMNIYNLSMKNYDVVSISPKRGTKFWSKLFYMVYNRYNRGNYPIQTEVCRVLSRRVINRINKLNTCIPYRKAIYSFSGLRVYNVKYDFTVKSISTFRNSKLKFNTAIDSLILFTDIFSKITQALAIVMAIISLIMIVYTFVMYFSHRDIAPGWASMMGMISFCFSGLFFILSVIMRYFDVLIRLIFKKQEYLIMGIEKL